MAAGACSRHRSSAARAPPAAAAPAQGSRGSGYFRVVAKRRHHGPPACAGKVSWSKGDLPAHCPALCGLSFLHDPVSESGPLQAFIAATLFRPHPCAPASRVGHSQRCPHLSSVSSTSACPQNRRAHLVQVVLPGGAVHSDVGARRAHLGHQPLCQAPQPRAVAPGAQTRRPQVHLRACGVGVCMWDFAFFAPTPPEHPMAFAKLLQSRLQCFQDTGSSCGSAICIHLQGACKGLDGLPSACSLPCSLCFCAPPSLVAGRLRAHGWLIALGCCHALPAGPPCLFPTDLQHGSALLVSPLLLQ